MTRELLDKLHAEWRNAEAVFEAAYAADPNRKGMRGGDFRYRSDLHSPATREAALAFDAAGNAAKSAYRESRSTAPGVHTNA